MRQKFIENGYEIVEFEKKADIYVINTCTVTNMSDRKSRQILRRAKKKNKDSILVATGCYVQVSENLLHEINDIDIILGNNEKKDIVKYVEEFRKEKKEKISDLFKEKEYLEFGITTYTEKTRAVIKIQDGCDNFCTYCIIPFARGRVRSRKIENIKKEIEKIASIGIKEVVLTGIQIASYGKDLKEKIELIDLLEEINKIKRNRKNKNRFIRTKITFKRIYIKTKKIRKNLPALPFITSKWLYKNIRKNE